MADDVADDEGDPAAGQRDHVEPVAADPGRRSRRQVPVGDLHGGLTGQALGEQAVLQGQRGGALAGEPAGVVDADGGPAGQFLGEGDVVGVVRVLGAALTSTATPRVVPRARSGTATVERTRARKERLWGAWASRSRIQRSKSGSPGPLRTARPSRSARAGPE